MSTPKPPCFRCEPPRHGCTAHPDPFGLDMAAAYGQLAGAISGHLQEMRKLTSTRPRNKAAAELHAKMIKHELDSLAKLYTRMTGLTT